MFSMTMGSGASTTPPIAVEYKQQGANFQQSKTERKNYSYKNGDPGGSDRKPTPYKQNVKHDQLRQSFEINPPSQNLTKEERTGNKNIYQKEQPNSAMLQNMVRTMYTENPKLSDDLKGEIPGHTQPTNSVNTSNNNMNGNLQVLNQNLINPQRQFPKANAGVNQGNDGQFPQRNPKQQLKTQNFGVAMKSVNSSSKDNFSNPPKLNHALRQRHDIVEIQSQSKQQVNHKIEQIDGPGGKKKHEITLFSVNENTRGKLHGENRIDFPEIQSLKNDPKKVTSDQGRINQSKKEQYQHILHKKLPNATLGGHDPEIRNTNKLHVNMGSNQKYYSSNQQHSGKKHQLKIHSNQNTQQNSFFLPPSVPLENEHQILTSEYLAKRGASQSSQGFKATAVATQAVSLSHGKPGAETSFSRTKYQTPGSFNKFTPKTQNLAPTTLTSNNMVPDLKSRHQFMGSYDQYGIGSPASPATESMTAEKYLTADKLNSREKQNRQKIFDCVGSDQNNRSKNSLIVIKDGKFQYKDNSGDCIEVMADYQEK